MRAVILGVGSIGSALVKNLIKYFGKSIDILAIDDDIIDSGNYNDFYKKDKIGLAKVEVLKSYFPSIEYLRIKFKSGNQFLIKSADIVFDCRDKLDYLVIPSAEKIIKLFLSGRRLVIDQRSQEHNYPYKTFGNGVYFTKCSHIFIDNLVDKFCHIFYLLYNKHQNVIKTVFPKMVEKDNLLNKQILVIEDDTISEFQSTNHIRQINLLHSFKKAKQYGIGVKVKLFEDSVLLAKLTFPNIDDENKLSNYCLENLAMRFDANNFYLYPEFCHGEYISDDYLIVKILAINGGA